MKQKIIKNYQTRNFRNRIMIIQKKYKEVNHLQIVPVVIKVLIQAEKIYICTTICPLDQFITKSFSKIILEYFIYYIIT